ncbi:MAG: sulfite exporter TauE/SafE family protein [Patescibacteria group bacterium]
MNQVWLAFLTGITTGGISCFAVQGGLLASSLNDKQTKYTGVSMFIAAKVFAYTLLGAGLGAIGSSLTITPQVQGWMQIFAGIVMLATAARILNIHPIFRYFVIEPPKFILRLLRNKSKTSSLFAPAILGLSTILIPCGITQGMMILAIASGSPFLGAAILLAFTLGTSPVFFGLGIATFEILKRKSLSYIAALVILILGIISINTGQVLRGSVHTLQNYWKVVFSGNSAEAKEIAKLTITGEQIAEINVTNSGYSSVVKKLKVGVPVKLNLITNNTGGCVRTFTIPSLNISKILPQTGNTAIQFTPTKTGLLTYTCSMGMYSGSFMVVN